MKAVGFAAAVAALALAFGALTTPASAGEQCWYGPLGVRHCAYAPGEPSFYPVPPADLGYGSYPPTYGPYSPY